MQQLTEKDIKEVKRDTVFSSRSVKNMASASDCTKIIMSFHSRAFLIDKIDSIKMI